MEEPLGQWFAREILVHEEGLTRFLLRSWPYRDEVHDLRQDTYVRVYEAARSARPGQPRAFLYATARNLMIDRVRHARVVPIEMMGDLEALNIPTDQPEPPEHAGTWQELRQLMEALDRLPDRCRAAVWLHKVEDLSYTDVALRQGVSVKTIEKQISKGLRYLADFYLNRRTIEALLPEQTMDEMGREHPHGSP